MTKLEGHSRIGIDVGRVLVGASTDDGEADTSFLTASDEVAVRIPPEPSAFDVVREIVVRTGGGAYVVSKCGKRIQRLTLLWMEHQRFFEHTGLPREHVHFVRTRPEKRVVAERLGLTHFVDDRLDVLEPMRGLVPSLLWFGAPDHRAPEGLVPVRGWSAVRRVLL